MIKYKVAQVFQKVAPKGAMVVFTKELRLSFYPKSNHQFWLLSKEKMSPRHFKNRPIWSH